MEHTIPSTHSSKGRHKKTMGFFGNFPQMLVPPPHFGNTSSKKKSERKKLVFLLLLILGCLRVIFLKQRFWELGRPPPIWQKIPKNVCCLLFVCLFVSSEEEEEGADESYVVSPGTCLEAI